MIKIVFFAKYREQFGAGELELASVFHSIQALADHLKERYGEKVTFLADKKCLVSLNQELANLEQPVKSGDTVAFYPPVTGG